MSDDVTYRWEVQVEGHHFDIGEVATLLNPKGYVLQLRNDKKWYLSGPSLEDAPNAGNARRLTEDVIRIANSVLRVSDSRYRPVTVGSTVREGDKVHVLIQAKPGILRMKTYAPTIISGQATELPPPLDRERRWFAAAQRDANVRTLLDLFENDREDYDRYYRALELIRHDLRDGDKEIRQLMGWSKPQFSGFTEALNAARHEKPNRNPRISMKEAVELGRNLVCVWLDHKSQNST